MLVNIHASLYEALTEWLRKRLGGLSHAVDIKPRKMGNSDKTLLYLLKGCDPQTAHSRGIKYKNQGIVPFRRCTTSRNINAQARQAWKDSGIIKMDARRFPDKYAREGTRTK